MLTMLYVWTFAAVEPELVIQASHSVSDLVLSSDARWVVTAGERSLKIWDVKTAKLWRSIGGADNHVVAVAISRDGKLLARATAPDEASDAKITLFETASGAEKKTLATSRGLYASVGFSPDGKQTLLVQPALGKLVDTASGSEEQVFGGKQLRVFAFSASGKQLALADGATLKLYDAKKRRPPTALQAEVGDIVDVRFVKNDTLLFVVGKDGAATYEVKSGRATASVHTAKVLTGAWTPETIALLSEDASHLFDASGKPLRAPIPLGALTLGRASSDGHLFASVPAADASAVELYDTQTGQRVRGLRGYTRTLAQFSVSRDDRYLLTNDGQLWDLERARLLRQLTLDCASVHFLPDGKRFICASGHDVTTRERDTGALLQTVATGPYDVFALAPSGRAFALAQDRDLSVWSAAGQKQPVRFEGLGHVASLAFSPDERWLYAGDTSLAFGRNQARRFDLATGEGMTVAHHGFCVWALAPSHDGTQLATGAWDKHVSLWRSGGELQAIGRLEGHATKINALAFSPDDTRLLSGSEDGHARLWDTAEKKTIADLEQQGTPRQVGFTHDGKWAIVASNVLRIYDAKSGKAIGTFAAVAPGDDIVVIEDGAYRASRGGLRGAAIRLGERVFPFEQFDLVLNRPDRVLAAFGRAPKPLEAAYEAAYHKRLRKLKVDEKSLALSFDLPTVTLLSQPPLATNADRITVKVQARDPAGSISRLHVWVNDVPLHGSLGLALEAAKVAERSLDIALGNGRNLVQIAATNARGSESLRETFEVQYSGPPRPKRLHAVLIGVSRYKDAQYNLDYAAKDARDLGAVLQAKGHAETALVIDADATRETILGARKKLEGTQVDDEVVVFVAGHGLLDANLDYYFATTDIDFEQPAVAGIGYDALEAILDGIPARHKLLLMDTCHSGEVDKESSEVVLAQASTGTVKRRAVGRRGLKAKGKLPGGMELNALLSELFSDLRRGSGAIVISSAGGAQYAQESSEYKNGVFTFAILDGIRTAKADMNRDGVLTVRELRDYVIEEVPKMTKGEQTPTARRDSVEFDFPLF